MTFITKQRCLTFHAPRAGLEGALSLITRAIARTSEESLSNVMVFSGMRSAMRCGLCIHPISMCEAPTNSTTKINIVFCRHGSIRHSRSQIKQGSPETSGFAFADQIGRGLAFEFIHFREQPGTDFRGLHQLLEFRVNVLDFA